MSRFCTVNQIEYFWANPPRCLAGFIVEPAELTEIVFDGHGEPLNPVFRVRCQCGESTLFVLGHYCRNPDFNNIEVFLSPIVLRCKSCDRTAELIDTDVHGYDGEQGASCTMRGTGEPRDFVCPTCGPQPFKLFARFEYSDDVFDDEWEYCRGRESDFFTWFRLRGICARCGQLREIADFECA